MDFLKDIIQLNRDKVYSINQLEWWLLKYSEEYKNTKEHLQFQHLTDQIEESPIRLPSLGESNADNTFLDLYLALDEIFKFHRKEKYFEQEVLDYYKIRNSDSNVKTWISKNESFGADIYVCFLIDYLDYDENDNEVHLSVNVPSLKELEIYINRVDFKNTIEFLEIFNEHYWV